MWSMTCPPLPLNSSMWLAERKRTGGDCPEVDLQNRELGLYALWLSQTTWWQDNNKEGIMLTILRFAYTSTTDYCPQPYMILQLNDVRGWENHNLKAWKLHIVPIDILISSKCWKQNKWLKDRRDRHARKERDVCDDREEILTHRPDILPQITRPLFSPMLPPAWGIWPHSNGTALMCYIENKTKIPFIIFSTTGFFS